MINASVVEPIVKTGPTTLVDFQYAAYQFINPVHRPQCITRRGPNKLVYERVPGGMCNRVADIWNVAISAVWSRGLPRPISHHARVHYYEYTCGLCSGLNKTAVYRALTPMLYAPLTPVYFAHGDMTCCNAILTPDNKVVFIDPADCHGLECQEIDEAKLLQSYDGWERVKYGCKLDYGPLPFKVKPAHKALLLSHYVRMLRYQTDAPRAFAVQRIKGLCDEI